LKEKRILILFEEKMIRRMLGTKREKVTGRRRKLHGEKLRRYP